MTIILIIILFLLILNPNISSLCVISTAKTWLYSLVPVMYPYLIIIDILSKDYLLEFIGYYLHKKLNRFIKLEYHSSFIIFIISIICGSPSSTKLINNKLTENKIDLYEADTLIYACSNLSLPYLIYIISIFNVNPLIYILIQVGYSISVINIRNKKNNINFEAIPVKNKTNFIKVLFDSINKNIDIIFSILGLMIFFNIILSLFNIDIRFYSFFEILNGNKLLLELNINKKLKNILLISSLSFLGISMHLQIMLIYSRFNYLKFLGYKLFHCLMSILIFLFI